MFINVQINVMRQQKKIHRIHVILATPSLICRYAIAATRLILRSGIEERAKAGRRKSEG